LFLSGFFATRSPPPRAIGLCVSLAVLRPLGFLRTAAQTAALSSVSPSQSRVTTKMRCQMMTIQFTTNKTTERDTVTKKHFASSLMNERAHPSLSPASPPAGSRRRHSSGDMIPPIHAFSDPHELKQSHCHSYNDRHPRCTPLSSAERTAARGMLTAVAATLSAAPNRRKTPPRDDAAAAMLLNPRARFCYMCGCLFGEAKTHIPLLLLLGRAHNDVESKQCAACSFGGALRREVP
jgi:hypothetical protein